MAKTETGNNWHPDSIILSDKTVVSWDQATPEQQQSWLQENNHTRHQNALPDKGNGKRQRKKGRRPRHHS